MFWFANQATVLRTIFKIPAYLFIILLLPSFRGRLLPSWVPGHPSTYWCHARHILLATTYCQLNRLSAEEDELVQSLRQVMGSQTWDAAFTVLGFLEVGVHNDPEYNTCLKKADSFLKRAQIVDNPPNYQRYYRQMNKGGFPFSNRDNDWIVSDCTAEAIKALMLLEEQCPFIGDHIAPQRLLDGINVLLNMRNSDGGFSSYETRWGSWLLEAINCAETYADCMVDHTYIECTSSVMQVLKFFQKKFPDHRTEEIRRWGLCFTHGPWFALEAFACLGYIYHNGLACNEVTRACAWLVSKQMKDGGWGEEFESYKFHKYIQHTISQVHQTVWALLGLMAVRYPDVRVLERGVQVLIDKQQAIGDWPQGDIATGFYKAGTLHYSAYRNIFPIFALARFTHLYPDSPLVREHLKNGPRHSTEDQTMKH